MNTSQTNIVRSNDEIWHGNIKEMILFFEINKAPPSLSSKYEREKKLAHWILQQLSNRKNGMEMMTSEEIRNIWDTTKNTHIKYFISDEDIWHEKIDEILPFFETNQTRPSLVSEHGNESTLNSWMSHHLQNKSESASDEIRDIWDNFKNNYTGYVNANVNENDVDN